ncbi:MAG: hypothetical protein AAFQ89_05150 [Cyanobacteria bacterium J06626_18]
MPPSTPTQKPLIQYRDRTAQFYTEDRLSRSPGQLPLDMVYLPPGSFQMDFPEDGPEPRNRRPSTLSYLVV